MALKPEVRGQLGNVENVDIDTLVPRALQIWNALPRGADRGHNFDIEAIVKKYGPSRPPQTVSPQVGANDDLLKAIQNLSNEVKALSGRQGKPSGHQRPEPTGQRQQFTCYYCFRPGHMVRDCRTRMADEKSGNYRKKEAKEVRDLRQKVEELQAGALNQGPVKE